jgi:hypothetical protein
MYVIQKYDLNVPCRVVGFSLGRRAPGGTRRQLQGMRKRLMHYVKLKKKRSSVISLTSQSHINN